jgi:hypothetical protein
MGAPREIGMAKRKDGRGGGSAVRYVTDQQEVERVAPHCFRLGYYDRYEGVPAERVDQLFFAAHESYAKVFHAVYEDLEFGNSHLAWTESEQHIQWWKRSFGTEPPDPRPRLDVWEAGELDSGSRLLWRDHRGPLKATTDAFASAASSWPQHLIVSGHLDPVSLDALLSVLGGLHPPSSAIWMFRRKGTVAASRLQEAGVIDDSVELGDWVLATGPLEGVRAFVNDTGLPPDWWWAADNSWEVFSDDESQVTFVAGTADIVAGVLNHRARTGLRPAGSGHLARRTGAVSIELDDHSALTWVYAGDDEGRNERPASTHRRAAPMWSARHRSRRISAISAGSLGGSSVSGAVPG